MNKKLKFFIVDDDRVFVKLTTKYLEDANHHVAFNTSSISALDEIIHQKPAGVTPPLVKLSTWPIRPV